MCQLAFDRRGQAGDDHKSGLLRLQPLDQGMIVKPFIGLNNHRADPRGNLRETRGEEVGGPAGSVDLGRPQLTVPEVFAPPLEAEQWMIRMDGYV